MKLLLLAIAVCLASFSRGQTNTRLSNLVAPTAVNVDLSPESTNARYPGSYSLGWNSLYLINRVFFNGSPFLHNKGTSNTLAGNWAGFLISTEKGNMAIGDKAPYIFSSDLYNTASDLYNTASGYRALYSNTTGYYNTATGARALYANTSGYANTATGAYSLRNNTTGLYNTAGGHSSLYSNTTGSRNTALGYYANVSTGNLTNATAIGYLATVDASNKVRIGNTSVTSIGGHVGWSIFSDGRYKKDIKENVQGLAFINSLRPITYTVNIQSLNEYYNKGREAVSNDGISDNQIEAANAEMKKAEEAAARIVYNGFVAQEVEEAAKKLNFEFSGVDKPQSKDGLYGLRYDNFIVPLVKAVQELSAINDEKDVKINKLQEQINELKAIVSAANKNNTFTQTDTNPKITDAYLSQNVPNPFVNTSTISFSLPPKFLRAQIIITDKSGKQLKQLNISGYGNGTLHVDASTLSSGTYNYSLIIDGKITSTKQMIVAK